MSEKKENKSDVIAALVAVLLVVATFGVLIWVASARSVGTISVDGDVRRGSEQTFTYQNDKIQTGQYVHWYVNNEQVATTRYDDGAELNYLPMSEGTTVIRAVAGKYNKILTVNVMKPLLTISARDLTVTYGEEPNFCYDCDGLLDGDTLESLNCNVTCGSEHCGCGIFDIVAECDECCGYDVQCNNGTLTVLPKELKISTKIVKTYDGKTETECPDLQLEGVADGDEVVANFEKLYFQSKNAGVQKIVTANVSLCGKDCANYTLCDDWEGVILPKTLQMDGLKICDKSYDGTTKAQIEKLGKLNGILDGDSVAIGTLEVDFENAEVGTQKVVVKKISLVGFDKDNYVVQQPMDIEAEISK